MKSEKQWLEEYGETHRHPTNRKIHFVCVPAIMFSLLGALWAIPVPAAMAQVPLLNWATVFSAFAFLFYLTLGLKAAAKMLVMTVLMIAVLNFASVSGWPVLWLSVGIFVVAWIGQFIGHKIEGRKPAFFTDLKFLLIGPLWVFTKH